ncbi:flagellar biosynthetic protein FliO [Clostridium sp.]|jgi:flagellar protein FliO/FliZ|uniref:flagellar biosynthetic protein FliO n=1 Tax=Clostridium sp. TaxID=1506 RepID=UPI0039F497F9
METKETIIMFVKVIVFLPFIIFLIYLFFKYGGAKLEEMQSGKHMRILDRLPLTKDNSLLVVKIGERGYVISSAQGRVEILMELSDSELSEIEKDNKIQQYGNFKEAVSKLIVKKEDNK